MGSFKFFREKNLNSNDEVRMAQDVVDWSTRFLVPPHPMMRRHPGTPEDGEPVCPFVRASLRKSLFYFDFNYAVTGSHVDEIVSGMLPYLFYFPSQLAPEEEAEKDDVSLVVLFPKYKPQNYSLLHMAHGVLKDQFVKNGLMLAEFYPGAKAGSKHNEDLPVYNAPHAFMAIRYMAPHDVLFIGDNLDWFRIYDAKFADFWNKPISPSYSHLQALYQAAIAKFRQ